MADLGCGYGRHLRALADLRQGPLLGLDRSALLLGEARREAPSARLLQGDLRALPLRTASLGAAFCFYSSMFLGTEADAAQALREAARALRPRARLVLTTDNPLRLAQAPRQSWQEDVAGLGRVREESAFDAATFVDEVRRTVECPGGEILSAVFRIRYYLPARLAALSGATGLSLLRLEPDGPLTVSTPQLIAVFARSP